jgi:hypothetical protein
LKATTTNIAMVCAREALNYNQLILNTDVFVVANFQAYTELHRGWGLSVQIISSNLFYFECFKICLKQTICRVQKDAAASLKVSKTRTVKPQTKIKSLTFVTLGSVWAILFRR